MLTVDAKQKKEDIVKKRDQELIGKCAINTCMRKYMFCLTKAIYTQWTKVILFCTEA